MIEKIKKKLSKLESNIFYDYNIGQFTWFRTGGNAKVYIIVKDNKELEIILNEINGYKYFVLGAGSNLLVRDRGYDGIIMKLGKGFNQIKINDNNIHVGASILDTNLSNFAKKNEIEGFEFFSGIPGTIGGAIKMNAGCFGRETKDNLKKILAYDKSGKKKFISSSEINLDYRSSNINESTIISEAVFTFDYGDKDEIEDKILKVKEKRLLSQPIKEKTSGSTFKNPQGNFAAKLIQSAGCKGMTVGDAMVSPLHSNFLINRGNATASDIENLGNLIKEKVHKKFNIDLNWEVKIIGK